MVTAIHLLVAREIIRLSNSLLVFRGARSISKRDKIRVY